MNFNHLSERTSLKSVTEFLAHGDYSPNQPKEKNYEERFAEAGKKIEEFCEKNFEDKEKRMEAAEYLFQQIGAYEGIAFEMGVLTGVKIAVEVQEKMADLKLKA